ncbi:MAG: hypothetical protein HZA52_21435 [Planctomycetes bacterium]|nr:hypothetical protein [Planctomycetota bacterium]
MRSLVLACAFAVSAASVLLELVGSPAWTLAPASHVGWVVLVWSAALTFAGFGERAWSALSSVAACLPVLALALGADLRSGDPWAEGSARALAALAVFAAWGVALERSARSELGARIGRTVWFVLALGVPALVAALEWGAADEAARAPVWLAFANEASPLAWSRELAARDLASGWRALPLAPLGAALLLFAVATRLARKERA